MHDNVESSFRPLIEEAWEKLQLADFDADSFPLRSAIDTILALLQEGKLRVAEKKESGWHVHQWLKKAILLSFQIYPNERLGNAPSSSQGPSSWYDKIPLKFTNWTEEDFKKAQIRVVPGAIVRGASYVAPKCILMPSFINVGAYVGQNTMVDTWVTIGSCAQIGENCHISGGVGIGGVLEPLQANPVIIEDNCFIGARSEIAEGVLIEEGSVISMGTFISASTRIIDRQSGAIYYGRVPPYSVVIPGSMPSSASSGALNPALACAVIVKRVDAKTRAKTALNELLRV